MKNDQKPQGSPGSDDSSWIRSLGYFGIILGDLAGCTGAGIGIGYLAWKKWNAPWWVLLLTSLAGLTLAFYRLYLMTIRDVNDEDGKQDGK